MREIRMRPFVVRTTCRGVIVVVIGALAACSGIGIKADAGYSQFELSGNVALAPTAGNINLGTIKTDVGRDLGLDEAMGSPYGRAEVALGIASLTFSGFSIDQQGSDVLTARFGDLSASTPVRTDIAIKNLKAALHFDIINVGVLRVSPGVGVDVFDINLAVDSLAVPSLSESLDTIAPVPMLFGQAEVDLGWVEVVGDIGGLKANVGDANGTFFDIELLARFKPASHIELFAGYRHIFLEASGKTEGQDFSGDLRLQGFVVGGGIRF